MANSILVFRNQFAQFNREKGMLFFYGLTIAIMGIVLPIFIRGIESSLTTAALITATFLRPTLSDSVAGEREHRTLETLLSSPMNGKSIIWGKFQFCLFFAVSFFGLTALCAVFTNLLIGREIALAAWQWIGIILIAVLNFSAISIAGVHASATSGDMRVANSRVSLIAYPLGLLFAMYIALIVSASFIPALIISLILICIYLCVIMAFTFKTIIMKQSNYFENTKYKKRTRSIAHENRAVYITPKSQLRIVFGFELKYLMTLKSLLLNYGAFCFVPALIACLSFHYTGKFDLNYAVFLTVLFITRVPTNLIAYSIGGEKVYRTGESLLSTPLSIRTIFLAKCLIPLTVSAIMLILSSLLTLMGTTIISRITPEATLTRYTVEQLVLLLGVGIMSSMLMIFISAIFSVVLKTPRHGLYVTSFLSFLFVVPVLAIVYLTNNILLWSVIYVIVLLVCNVMCIFGISDKITHPQIVSKL
jgi:ABC-type Na+ efflux pump permease subunit